MNRKRVGNAAFWFLILGGYFLFVKNTGMGVPCPFQYFFHLKCPGCGITHLVLALSEGDFAGAFQSNPVLFLGSPFLLWLLARQLFSYVRERRPEWRGWERVGMNILLFCLLLFGVIRNLPDGFFR